MERKNIIMKKNLMLLGAALFPVISILSVCACKNIDDIIVRKVPLTRANLNKFFAKNKVWEYTGEYFFKSADQQTFAETSRMTEKRTSNIFKSLLDQTLGQKFYRHFTYEASKYSFEIKHLSYFNSFNLNQVYNLKFHFIIRDIKNTFYFEQKDLVLKFKETSQYDDQKWLKMYLNYLQNCSTFLWQQKYANYETSGSLPYHPDAEWTEQKEKDAYTNNNNKDILAFLSNYYTKLLTNVNLDANNDNSLWIYSDKQFNVKAQEYKYLKGIPPALFANGGVRAKTTLVFTNTKKPEITLQQNFEIWMAYKKIFTEVNK